MLSNRRAGTTNFISNKFYLEKDSSRKTTNVESLKLFPEELRQEGYTRSRIELRNKNSFGQLEMFSPELDGLRFGCTTKSKNKPFQELQEAGFTTPLLEHFAYCESVKQPYRHPETREILFKRITLKGEYEGQEHSYCYIFPSGGFEVIRKIWSYDKLFFKKLIECAKTSYILHLYEFHVAVDYNSDLMPYVTHSMQVGKYLSQNVKPYVFGYFGGKWIQSSWTKRGKEFQERKSMQIDMKTVYFGTSQRSRYSVIIYDKTHEQKVRKAAYLHPTTRIEVRAHLDNGADIDFKAIDHLIESLDYPTGIGLRSAWIRFILFSVVVFTKTYDKKEGAIAEYADWFEDLVLEPLSLLSRQFPLENLGTLVTGNYSVPWIEANDKPLEKRRGRGRPPGAKNKKGTKKDRLALLQNYPKTDEFGVVLGFDDESIIPPF